MPLAAASAAARSFGHDAAVERTLGEHPARVSDADRVDDLVVDVEACDVGEEDEASRAETERERGGRVVGVHVQRPDRERCDDRDLSRLQRCEDLLRPARQRVADLPERRHRHGEEPVAVPEHGHREVAERGAERGVDLLHRLADDLERRARRAPAALDELDGNAAPLHLLGDLRAGAVHDDDLVTFLGESEDAVCSIAGDGAADLHDQPHDRYSALMRT